MPTDSPRLRPAAAAAIALLMLAATGCVQMPASSAGDVPAPAPPAEAPAADAAPSSTVARTGSLQVVQWPVVTIDRKEFRAAPGARILNSNNLTVTPNLVPAGAKVQYELDALGQLRLIRVLDAAPGGARVAPPRPPTSSPR